MESRIERLVTMSRAVLDRLERGDRLSVVLPQARAVADFYGDAAHAHWLDCEIYGLLDVPFARGARKTKEHKAAVYLFCELRCGPDVRQLTVDGLAEDWPKDKAPDRSMIAHQSVGHLERTVEEYRPPTPGDASWAPATDWALRLDVMHSEHERILGSVRAYLYQYMDKIWSWALQERDNLRLLGPDYRIVIDSLDALETGVGQELLAALSHLGSTNPAEWALSALACRNVILSLGRTLFPLRTGAHHCAMLGKDLQLKGEKELNWLTAYIDVQWQNADDQQKEKLEGLAGLALRIYETGSRGKNKTALGHGQVQELVVDTFRLVFGLKELAALQPLSGATATGG